MKKFCHEAYLIQRLCLVYLFLLASIASRGGEQAVLVDEQAFINLSPSTYVHIDTANSLTIGDLIGERAKPHFELCTYKEIHHDHTEATIWYKIHIRNTSNDDRHMVFCVKNSTIPLLQVYIKMNNQLLETNPTGVTLPFDTRSIESRHFCYKLRLPANKITTIYCQIRPLGDSLNNPVFLFDEEYFFTSSMRENIFNGFFYGLMMFSVIASIIFYFGFSSTSEKLRFFLVSVLVIFMLWNLSLDGLAFQFLWPYSPWINQIAIFALPLVGVQCLSFFSSELYRVKIQNRWFYPLNVTLSILVVALISLYAFGKPELKLVHIISLIIGMLMFANMLFNAILHFKQNKRQAIYFLLAFFALLFCEVIILFRVFGDSFVLDFYNYSLKIFLGSQSIILTLVTFGKFKSHFLQSYVYEIEKQNGLLALKTQEIETKNRQIQYVNNELSVKNELVQKKNFELKHKNQIMFESMKYAQRIQNAILPDSTSLGTYSKEMFVFMKSKELLSGDFYFVSEKSSQLVIATVDCTGHGIPGALLSILGHDLLNMIVKEKNISSPRLILHNLQEEIQSIIKFRDMSIANVEGMDIGVVSIDNASKHLCYAGAKIPLIVFRKEKMFEFKGENFSIGNVLHDRKNDFEEYHFEVEQGDMVYTFTDGFADQFNERLVKFKKMNLKIVLSEISTLHVNAQKEELEKRFDQWKGQAEQTDDVLIIGVKI